MMGCIAAARGAHDDAADALLTALELEASAPPLPFGGLRLPVHA